jgi:riboflavin synthase
MFTGLVEEVGRVRSTRTESGNRLFDIEAKLAAEVKVGDSVAVEGCCLTVVEREDRWFRVEATGATLKSTTLDGLRAGSEVNLERALAVGDRLGGHMVQGHVDEAGTVRRVDREAGHWRIRVRVSRENERLLVERGSICVNGVSLTIAGLGTQEFGVNIIPHTWENTTLCRLRAGDRVNIEHDLLVKAVRRLLGGTGLTA